MNIIRLIILIQSFFSLFIAGGMFFKDNSLKNKSISIFSAIFALEIFYFLFGTSKAYYLYPELSLRFYFSFGLLYGPILYIHFKSILDEKFKLNTKYLIHFLPLIFLNVYMLDIIFMSTNKRILLSKNYDFFLNYIIPLNYFRCAHQIFYGIILIHLYKKYNCKTNTKFYLGSLSIIYFTSTIIISFLVLFANSWRDFSLYYLLNYFIVFLIIYVLYKDPKFFRDFKKKYEFSNLKEVKQVKLKKDLLLLFSKEPLYLNKQLNIDYLAAKLNTKSHHLSQVFTIELKENFNDFVNRFRIEHSKELLRSLKHKNLKIEAIAEESGFNNKVTFYKAFSKFENTTPSKYRKTYLKL